MVVIRFIVYLAVVIGGLLLLAGRAGMLTGKGPGDLGVNDGRLKRPSKTPNSVSSQASLHADHPQRAYADIAPFAVQGDGKEALARLAALLSVMQGVKVIKQEATYVYAQCETPWLRFTDDLELWLDEANAVIHVRSASRLGQKDFGANRNRVERLRAAYMGANAT